MIEADEKVNERIHVAGQIPLIPPTLLLPTKPRISTSHSTEEATPSDGKSNTGAVQLQATLALQHVRKIITVLRSPSQTGGGWEGWVESCVAWWALPSDSSARATGTAGSGERGCREVEVVRKALRIWAEQVSCSNPLSPLKPVCKCAAVS